jgi:hypothetical protein
MHARPRSVRMLVTPLLMALAVLGVVGAAPAAAGWLGATDLAPANDINHSVAPPAIAVARDSTAFAAYNHWDGANNRIAVLQRSPGGAFGAVRDLSPAGENSFSPALAVDRQGNATIAWLQAVPSASVIKARFHPAGGDWGATQTLSAPGIFNGPAIAVGDNGAAVVAWGRTTASPTVQVEAAIRPAGSPTFGAALPASPNAGTGLCQSPHVAMDAAGDVAAIWTRRTSNAGDYHVESATKPAGAAAFSASEPRSGTNGNSPCNSDIQMTPGGRVTAVWDFNDNANPGLTFVSYADRGTPFATGSFGPAALLSPNGVNSGQPHLALDEAGNAAATWLSGGTLQSAVRTGTGGWTAPKPLSGLTSINGSGHAIADSPNGDALVAWVGASNGSDAIFSARRRGTDEFGEITPVATLPPASTTDSFSFPAIALDDQGNGFAVWQHSVGSGGGTTDTAQIAAYDAAAPAITSASVPATGTAGQAVAMSAAASDRMSGVALHFDFGDGGGADGGSVSHTYGAAGAYTVTVLATDAAGNQSSTTRSIQVAAAPAAGGSTGGSSTGGGATGPRGPQRVAAVSALSYDRLSNGNTRLRALVLDRLSGPETVQLSCVGKKRGCLKKANHTTKKHGRKLVLTKYVKGMTLRPKAQIVIKVSRPGFVSRIFRYTMVKRKDPKKATRCLTPGQKKSVAC